MSKFPKLDLPKVAFPNPFAQKEESIVSSSPVPPKGTSKDNKVGAGIPGQDNLLQRLARGEVSATKFENELTELKSKQTEDEATQFQSDAFYAAVGGFALGALGGVALDIYISQANLGIELGLDLSPIFPPLVLAFLSSAGAYSLGTKNNLPGKVVRGTLAYGPRAAGDAVTRKVGKTVEEIKATPQKIAQAVEDKVDDTVKEIKSTPGKITAVVEENVEKAVVDIKAAPGRVAEATEKAVNQAVDDTKEKIEQTIDDTKEKIEKTVDDAVRLPGRKLDEVRLPVMRCNPQPPLHRTLIFNCFSRYYIGSLFLLFPLAL